MSTGGIFTLITNDGKQDRMLMATALLHERLRGINQENVSRNGGSPSDLANIPTLLDIERTHVLFTNAHFKPFAALGMQYHKVSMSSGTVNFGSRVQFSIPQFGDFFHDIACHVTIDQPTMTVTGGTAASNQPLMRWCHFPGERLFSEISQEVNGNKLDSYSNFSVNCHREYRVAPNKRAGWDRAVGQEEPLQAFLSQPNWAHSGVAAADIVHRTATQVHVGNQTPSGQKTGKLEMFIPLLFWYNKDVRLAVPSVAIPYGQRFITLLTNPFEQLAALVPRGSGTWAAPNGTLSTPAMTMSLYINNIFVNPEVHQIYIRRIGFSLIRVHREQVYNCTKTSENILLQQMKWPIEYLFVGMKLTNYHAPTSNEDKARSMDRWHLWHQQTATTWESQGQNIMSEQELVVGNAPVGVSALGALSDGGLLNVGLVDGDTIRVGGNYYGVRGAGAAAGITMVGVTVNPAPAVAQLPQVAYKVLRRGLQQEGARKVALMNTIKVTAHQIPIYDTFDLGFYNAYTAYHYGGPNINTPEDTGLAFIPFCLYPGTYQPSGHINVSRAREFYLDVTSSVIGVDNVSGVLHVVASAINFLLISDGSAVLRYST
jgi:hypothetical protein